MFKNNKPSSPQKTTGIFPNIIVTNKRNDDKYFTRLKTFYVDASKQPPK